MVRVRRVGVALAATVLLVTTACSSDGDKAPDPIPVQPSPYKSYVAMGDSAVAGPGIAPIDLGSGVCARSRSNWPALLAKALGIPKVHDVSCGGAVRSDITTYRTGPAQIDALTRDTDLVTISIGGNDEGLFSKTILSCLYGPYEAAVCETFINTKLAGIAARTTARVAAALSAIQKRAPNARIVVVGYLRILPGAGGCRMQGLSSERVLLAGKAMAVMDGALHAAAERTGVDYVSMASASSGHEACTKDDAWVNGMRSTAGNGALLHPNKAGMRAVAKILAKHLAD